MKIRAKFLWLIVPLSMITLVLSSLMYYQQNERAFTKQIFNQLTSLAAKHKFLLERLGHENIERLNMVTNQIELSGTLPRYLKYKTPQAGKQLTKILNNITQAVYHFTSITLIDVNGNTLASTAPVMLAQDFSESKAFILGRKAPNTDILSQDHKGDVSLILSAPIKHEHQTIGVVLIEYDTLDIKEAVADYTGLGLTGETVIVRRLKNGDAQYIAPTRFDVNAAMNRTISHKKAHAIELLALNKQPQTYENTLSYNGSPILAATQYIPNMDWGLITQITIHEIYAPLRQLWQLLVTLAIVIACGVVLIAMFISRIATKPMVNLTQAAKLIHESGHARMVEVKSNDEAGDLAKVFNSMTEKLVKTNASLEDNNASLEAQIVIRRRIEKIRDSLIKELKDKNTELEQFTYTVSHDLKSPLVTIQGFLGMLEQDIKNNDTSLIHDDIERIRGGADKMSTLLDNLLELSRIGRIAYPASKASLKEITLEAIEHMENSLRENNIEITIQDNLPDIFCDRTRFVEVMQNLIDNAIKYRGDQKHPHIEIGSHQRDNETIYHVADNGIGIEKKYIHKVFDLFERMSTNTQGSGVGLAIVRRIIEVHGGHVWAESAGPPNQGTRFYFTLPSQEDSPTSTQKPSDKNEYLRNVIRDNIDQ